jgi:hypothetical protein
MLRRILRERLRGLDHNEFVWMQDRADTAEDEFDMVLTAARALRSARLSKAGVVSGGDRREGQRRKRPLA